MKSEKENEKIHEPAICPKCGRKFYCSPSGKCWCYSVFVPPDKLGEIQEKYDSCLCQECLKSFSV